MRTVGKKKSQSILNNHAMQGDYTLQKRLARGTREALSYPDGHTTNSPGLPTCHITAQYAWARAALEVSINHMEILETPLEQRFLP